MSDLTSIPVKTDTRDQIRQAKGFDTSYDEFLTELLDDTNDLDDASSDL